MAGTPLQGQDDDADDPSSDLTRVASVQSVGYFRGTSGQVNGPFDPDPPPWD